MVEGHCKVGPLEMGAGDVENTTHLHINRHARF